MVRASPFLGLCPSKELASQVLSLPYDVLTRQEARVLANTNPYSFLRLTRSDLEFEDLVSPYDPQVYRRAQANLSTFMRQGVLRLEDKPSYYIYHIRYPSWYLKDASPRMRDQYGLVALFSTDDYRKNKIKKHEQTRPEKELDRKTHILTLKAQLGPVFLLYRHKESPGLSETLRKLSLDLTCRYDIEIAPNETHRLYSIAEGADTAEIKELASNLEAIYIADGHHRAASAVAAEEEHQAQLANLAPPPASGGHFLGVLFPDTQVQVLPYYRVVRDLNGMQAELFLDTIRSRGFTLSSGFSGHVESEPDLQQCGLYMARSSKGGGWYTLRWAHAPEANSNHGASIYMGVSVVQERILGPLLGIKDPRSSKRIDFIGGIKGTEGLEALVDSGVYAVAFAVPPVASNTLLQIADNGELMPPKSTWFEPKLRSGLVSYFFGRT